MLPAKIKIGAITYRVVEVDGEEIDGSSGDMSNKMQFIRINRNLTPEMKACTLIHEIFHCVDIEMEHDAVELLAVLWHQVLVENPGLAGIMSEKPKDHGPERAGI